ncbi:MAG: hypothetical protein HY897_23210 [Deltaproteobacteria bacterium]|nr:hypothetical protein [Deltaproteobacteria bacterium]
MDQTHQDIAEFNSNFFFKEFTFSDNDFYPEPGVSCEFGDHTVWIDDLLIIIQVKLRDIQPIVEPEREAKWLSKKVLGIAKDQIKDNIRQLRTHGTITITNNRRHAFELRPSQIKNLIKIVLYGNQYLNPLVQPKLYVSAEAGFIHVMPLNDYVGICNTLVTPYEIAEYLLFRENIIARWSAPFKLPSEVALVGQYLHDEPNAKPEESFAEYVHTLKQDRDSYDILSLLETIHGNIAYHDGTDRERDYYQVLVEFAKLHRLDLKRIKEMLRRIYEAVREDRFEKPIRVVIPHTECGFVFMNIQKEDSEHRKKYLMNTTIAAKYDDRLTRQVGVLFHSEGVDYAYANFPWRWNVVIETQLKANFPFRKKRKNVVEDRYSFEDE